MRRTQALILGLTLPWMLGGCIYSREIAHLRNDVEHALDAEYDRDFVIVLGPRTFSSIGWVARRVPDPLARMGGELISEIDRIKVGVYHTDDPGDRALSMDDMPRIRGSDWQVVVRTTEDDASVWVLYRERYGFVRDMLVLTLDGPELVIVRIEGRLDALVEQAMADADFVRSISGVDRW